MPKSKRFLSCDNNWKESILKVFVYDAVFVSSFKTAKPSSLGLDHSRKKVVGEGKISADRF